PSEEGVKMGALASHAHLDDVQTRVEALLAGSELVYGAGDNFRPVGQKAANGAFFAPTLLRSRDPHADGAAHEIEAFGPVSTLMAYDDIDEALALAARGKGSLVSTLATKDPKIAAHAVP